MDSGSSERFRGSSHSEEERAFLQQRVALFWKAVFLIALCANAIGLILDPASFVRTGDVLNRVSTLFFGLLWLFCRRDTAPGGRCWPSSGSGWRSWSR